jgi:hypothetical protein
MTSSHVSGAPEASSTNLFHLDNAGWEVKKITRQATSRVRGGTS